MTGNVGNRGLGDTRAVDILTTEHWSLLSSRSLGYQEMFGRTTIYVAILSGAVVALALVAQATRFGRETLTAALLLIAVALFVGLVTFARCVAINYEDARWVAGMGLLRQAYLEMVPGLAPYFITAQRPVMIQINRCGTARASASARWAPAWPTTLRWSCWVWRPRCCLPGCTFARRPVSAAPRPRPPRSSVRPGPADRRLPVTAVAVPRCSRRSPRYSSR